MLLIRLLLPQQLVPVSPSKETLMIKRLEFCSFELCAYDNFHSKQPGLEADYFRTLLQSNCGVSVLDFTPRPDGGSPHICLNRLNQVYSSFTGVEYGIMRPQLRL